MSYNMKVEKTSLNCKPTNKIKARRDYYCYYCYCYYCYYYYYYHALLLLLLSRVLSNKLPNAQNPLHTCPQNFPVDEEVANILPTCH